MGFDVLAFIALRVTFERGQIPDDAIATAQGEFNRFKASGGLALLDEQMQDDEFVSRSNGKPANTLSKSAVLRLKAEGKTQAETGHLLGLPRSTVSQNFHSES